MGTYKIIEVLNEMTTAQGKVVKTPAHKFCCMVSFNGRKPEYYEVEVPNDVGSIEYKNEKGLMVSEKIPLPPFTAQFVNDTLQKVADDLAAVVPAIAFSVVDGKVA